MARGVTAKTAAELVETHPAGRIRTKIEVFDWLMRNEDKRVGKNPAGYLVASIRADYQAPGDYQAAEAKARCRRGREARRAGQAPGEAAPLRTRTTAPVPTRPTSAPPGTACPSPSATRSWPP